MKNRKITWRLYLCLQAVLVFYLTVSVSAQHSTVIRKMFQSILPATTFSYTVDCASPLGTDAPSTIDDKIRETRYGFQERLNVTGYWPLTGTSLSDACVGENRRVLFHEPIAATPTVAANHGDLRIKDVGDVAELVWTDESENELQITSGGTLNITSLGAMANNTYLTAVNAAGDSTVDLIKANASDVAVIPDGSETATSGAPTEDADIANKKYVDTKEAVLVTQETAGIFGSRTNLDSNNDALVKDEVYKAGSDGIIVAYCLTLDNGEHIILYTDGTNPPLTVMAREQRDANMAATITVPVKKDDYFKITCTDTPIIYWLPIGTGACVKQP